MERKQFKTCTCGSQLVYGSLGPGRIGYRCQSCGFINQKKPRLGKRENNKRMTIALRNPHPMGGTG